MKAHRAKRKVKSVSKKQTNKNYKHLYQSIIGVIILFTSILLVVSMMFTSETGIFGVYVREILLGIFGGVGFILPFIFLYIGWIIAVGKHYVEYKMRIIGLVIFIVLLSCFLYIGLESQIYNPEISFSRNVVSFYENGTQLYGGGVIGGLLTVPLITVFGKIGAAIILLAGILITLIIIINIPLSILAEKIKSILISIKEFMVKPFKISRVKPKVKKKITTKKKKKLSKINDIAKIKNLFEQEIINQESYNINKAENNEMENEQLVDKRENKKMIQTKALKAETLELEHTSLDKVYEEYEFPPIDILKGFTDGGKSNAKKDLKEIANKLEQTLASFGVNAKVMNVSRGPTVTRYELSPGAGVKVSKIVGLADDLALNLAASSVRIEAPIPGKAAVGIEIPNKKISSVHLRNIIETREFKSSSSNITFGIGKDISGRIIVGDIAKMPHLLIAGATGSGKSVCINTLITSILYKARPDQVKLVMIDPKVVELGVYNGIPHLLIPVVTDPKKAAGALNWAVQEMVSRYKLFADKGVRDIKGYNVVLKEEGTDTLLPQIVIIIDELADLMMVAPHDVEDVTCRLAQMARAAGMHLVVATQRPSVDVITGVIKANIPSRISFAVSSQVDSRTILDSAGAEKLLGKGDMLYYPVGQPKPVRLQGALITDKEVEAVVKFIKSQEQATYDEDIIEKLENEGTETKADSGDNDVLLPQVIEMIVESGQASISIIQRRFKVGYARAARLIDQMEARGIVGGFEGSKPRKILVSKFQWEEMKAEQEVNK